MTKAKDIKIGDILRFEADDWLIDGNPVVRLEMINGIQFHVSDNEFTFTTHQGSVFRQYAPDDHVNGS